MEEAVEATAIAINYLGNAILEVKSRDLLNLARGVEEAADAAGVDCGYLIRAAGALRRADDEGRIRAVLELGDASAALEKIACAPLDALRGAAAHLARACREYQEAADSISKAQRTMEQRARRTCGFWCSSFWRRSQTQAENLAADEELGGQPKLLADNVRASIDLVSDARRELQDKADALVLQAKNLVAAADGAGVLPEELVLAISALEHAGGLGEAGLHCRRRQCGHRDGAGEQHLGKCPPRPRGGLDARVPFPHASGGCNGRCAARRG